jgi:uncharacterized membrane protein
VGTSFDRKSVEFGRVLAFTDGLFAIAMTLLVVDLVPPTISATGNAHELWHALDDLTPNFVSFFISFAVIGRYWVAHHQSVSLLDRMDRGWIGLNLVYLAFIAFLPFPTAMLGEYFENPVSVAIYAVNVAVISGMEVVLFRHAYRRGLLSESVPPNVYRFGAFMSLSPVVFFLASIPVAFVSTTLAVCVWALGAPFGIIANRWAPEGSEKLLLN